LVAVPVALDRRTTAKVDADVMTTSVVRAHVGLLGTRRKP
jgi:hypothetical protein